MGNVLYQFVMCNFGNEAVLIFPFHTETGYDMYRTSILAQLATSTEREVPRAENDVPVYFYKKTRNLSLCRRYIGQRLPCRTISITEGATMEYTINPSTNFPLPTTLCSARS